MSRNSTFLICVLALLLALSCSKKTDVVPAPAPTAATPVINSFTPATAEAGATVTITGSNFTGASAVTFGGTPAASFSVANSSTITAIIGTGSSGDVKITTAGGAATKSGFIFSQVPSISSFSPSSGSTGTSVTITGTNFTGATAVTFGGVAAGTFAVQNNTTITATIAGGATGDVKVTTAAGSTAKSGFTYTFSATPCKLPNQSSNLSVGLGFPRNADRQKTTGTVKVSVIFVDFSDAPATKTPATVFGLVSPTSETFINTISYGKLTLSFDAKFKWYRMSKPSTGYNFSALTAQEHRNFLQEAVNLADPEVDFSQGDQLLVITNPDAAAVPNGPTFVGTSAFNVTADSKSFTNAIHSGKDLTAWQGFWFPHEFGHSMGLADLYGYTGDAHRFVGTNLSMMGNILANAQEYNAWEKWLLGWVTDDQVRCVSSTGTGTIALTPLESTGGLKLLILPIDATTAVIVEDRRALGYDKNIVKAGPIVYVIDTKLASGAGVLKVLPINDADLQKTQAAMSVGQTITYGNITVKCTASAAEGSTIEYEKK